jgi:hypothetical protein
MIGYDVRICDYCECSIGAGQRWVREKIYDPRPTSRDAAYRHFHAEVFGGEELSFGKNIGRNEKSLERLSLDEIQATNKGCDWLPEFVLTTDIPSWHCSWSTETPFTPPGWASSPRCMVLRHDRSRPADAEEPIIQRDRAKEVERYRCTDHG